MDLARPGEIREHCDPNGVATFLEYLLDYGTEETRKIGERCIEEALESMGAGPRRIAENLLEKIRSGEREVFC